MWLKELPIFSGHSMNWLPNRNECTIITLLRNTIAFQVDAKRAAGWCEADVETPMQLNVGG